MAYLKDEHHSFENRCKIIQPYKNEQNEWMNKQMNEMQCKLPEQAQKLEVESRAVKEFDSSM